MNIDWFTFFAQIVNFLVLVALLRWLLYEPIVRAMNEREEKITSRLEEADRKLIQAEEKVAQYEEKTHQIDQQREELLKGARREAHEEHQRLLDEARQEVDRKRDEWHQAYLRERDDVLFDLRRQAGQMGVEAARYAISQLADADLEERMWSAFASRIESLDDAQREEIVRHLGDGGANVSVRSAFDVPDRWRERLREILRETFRHDAAISFEKSTDLICGLELDVGGYSLGWNVWEFLRELELEFGERLVFRR